MKAKHFFIICSLCTVFIGCSSTEIDDLKNKNKSLVKENNELNIKVKELTDAIAKLEKENEMLKLEIADLNQKNFVVDLEDKDKFVVHDLVMSLPFDYDGYNTKVYPFLKEENSNYTIQKGDLVESEKFIHVIEDDTNFISVKVNNEITGFIGIRSNPYQNGNFEFAETILVNGIETTVLKLESLFNVGEGTMIRELPSGDAKNLHEVTHKEGGSYHEVFQITADYEWVKTRVGDVTGWIPAGCLSVDRGGPVLNYPEERVIFELILSHEI